MRRPWATAALAAVSIAVALLVAELLVGWLVALEEVTLVHDPLLGFRGRPDMAIPWTREMAGGQRTVRTNSGGYHDLERSRSRAAGQRRVVFLGDSFLEAYQVEVEANFSQVLARALSGGGAGSGEPVEAVNLGVHGYGLGVHHLFVRYRLAAWSPDAVVLVLFLGNDLQDNYAPLASASVPRFTACDGELVYVPAPSGGPRIWLRDRVLARSNLMRFLWMRVVKTNRGAMQWARRAGLVSTPNTAVAGAAHQDRMLAAADHLLGRIADDLATAGVGLLVYVIPDPILLHHRIEAADGAGPAGADETAAAGVEVDGLLRQKARLEAGVLEILHRREIGFLYPGDLFARRLRAGEAMYRDGFGHFTAAAHQLSADLLEGPVRYLLDGAR